MSVLPPSSTRLEMSLRDDPAELERLAGAVEAWIGQADLSAGLAFQLNLALDELLTNTMSHGIDDDGEEHRISVVLSLCNRVVEVRITDDGKPFDPFTQAPPPDLESDVDDRPVGGLGVHLVRTFMDSVRYRRVGNHNVVELAKSVDADGR